MRVGQRSTCQSGRLIITPSDVLQWHTGHLNSPLCLIKRMCGTLGGTGPEDDVTAIIRSNTLSTGLQRDTMRYYNSDCVGRCLSIIIIGKNKWMQPVQEISGLWQREMLSEITEYWTRKMGGGKVRAPLLHVKCFPFSSAVEHWDTDYDLRYVPLD